MLDRSRKSRRRLIESSLRTKQPTPGLKQIRSPGPNLKEPINGLQPLTMSPRKKKSACKIERRHMLRICLEHAFVETPRIGILAGIEVPIRAQSERIDILCTRDRHERKSAHSDGY